MDDKLLFENWRKFLAEAPEDVPDIGIEPERIARGKTPEEEIEKARKRLAGQDIADLNPDKVAPKKCDGTVGEFLEYIKALNTAAKGGRAIAKAAKLAQLQDEIPGMTTAKRGVEAASAAGEYVAAVATALAYADFEMDFSAPERSRAPFLEFVTIDDKYRRLLSKDVIRNFLADSKSWLSRLSPTDLMPDIDVELENWIRTHPDFEGVRLDGVSDAKDDYEGWCNAGAPTAAKIAGIMSAASIEDVAKAGSEAAQSGIALYQRIAQIMPTPPEDKE